MLMIQLILEANRSLPLNRLIERASSTTTFFTNSSSTIKAKPGVQSRPEIKAYCKLCITKKNPNGKELNATDTFTAFKIHVENKHKRKQRDGDDNVK